MFRSLFFVFLIKLLLYFFLLQDFITQEYQVSVKEVLDNALQGREAANFEFPLYTKDRQRVEVLLNATTRRDVSGVVVGMIGVGQDITERKQVEEEKTRVAQELQTFIDTANAPIFGIDAHGLVNEWNNKAAEITGFSKLEVIGKDLVEVYITEEFRTSVRQVLDNALEGREKSNFEFPLFTKDQRRVEVLLNATTRRDVTGAIVGVIGVGQDITEMRRLMERETLLFQAQAANDAKSQFLATMSHEMRTPLNVIMGMNQLVIDTKLTKEQQQFTQQIKSSSEGLLHLINDILDLTKIEAGKLELVTMAFDLRSALEDSIDSIAGRAMGKGLEIVCFMDPNAQTCILGDPDRLRQILLNLFSNAVKFTTAGHVYVAVDVEEETSTHQTFRFKVFDSGIGISAEGQKKLFNRFSQVDSSTTRTYGGTGLGLAIAKQFAELMNGSMGVQSAAGKGSLFWFTAVFKKDSRPQPVFLPDNRGLRLLIIAHHEHLMNKLLRYAEAFGIIVTCSSSTDEALELCKSQAFDIILLAPIVQAPTESMSIGDDMLRQEMSGLASIHLLHPKARSVIICPITQLSQAAAYKYMFGETKPVLLSRPVRLSALYNALICESSPGFESDNLRYEEIESKNSSEPSEVQQNTQLKQKLSSKSDNCMVNDRPMRVLVVDDDAGQRMVVESMLSREGFEVDVAEDGLQAYKSTARVVYDIVLMDGFMPIKTGWEATEDIRRREESSGTTQKLIIIGVTGAATSPAERQKCIDCGMTDVIAKPISRSSIVQKIKYWVDALLTKVDEKQVEDDPATSSLIAANPTGMTMEIPIKDDFTLEDITSQVLVVANPFMKTVLKGMLKSFTGLQVEITHCGATALKHMKGTGFDIVLIEIELAGAMGGAELASEIRKVSESDRQVPIIGITSKKEAVDAPEFHHILLSPITRDSVNTLLMSYFSKAHTSKKSRKASVTSLAKKSLQKSSLRILIVEGIYFYIIKLL